MYREMKCNPCGRSFAVLRDEDCCPYCQCNKLIDAFHDAVSATLDGRDPSHANPDAVPDGDRWVCANGHASRWNIKSEARGGNVCPVCHGWVRLYTLAFPDATAGDPSHAAERMSAAKSRLVAARAALNAFFERVLSERALGL